MPKRAQHPRTDALFCKVPPILKEEIRRISALERFTESTVVFYLILRGLQAYAKDGKLFSAVSDDVWLEEILKGSQARRKSRVA